MRNHTRKYGIASAGVVALLLLGACDTIVNNNPSAMMAPGQIETYRDEFALETDTAALGDGQLSQIARNYQGQGDTPLSLTVTYDPHSKTNTAKKATQEMTRLKEGLRKRNVTGVEADIMPVQSSGDVSKTLISFDTVKARAPAGCDTARLDRSFTDWEKMGEDYRIGCHSETYFAKQVARPKDLQGNDVMDTADGRVNANTVELYKSGAPYKDLGGEMASE